MFFSSAVVLQLPGLRRCDARPLGEVTCLRPDRRRNHEGRGCHYVKYLQQPQDSEWYTKNVGGKDGRSAVGTI